MPRGHLLRAVIVVIAFLAALSASMNEAIGEEAGGILIGPFNTANSIGSLALISGGGLIFFRPRLAFFAICLGVAFIVPMQSWRLFPGMWCKAPGAPVCYGSYPAAVLNALAVLAVALAVFAAFLSSKVRSR